MRTLIYLVKCCFDLLNMLVDVAAKALQLSIPNCGGLAIQITFWNTQAFTIAEENIRKFCARNTSLHQKLKCWFERAVCKTLIVIRHQFRKRGIGVGGFIEISHDSSIADLKKQKQIQCVRGCYG